LSLLFQEKKTRRPKNNGVIEQLYEGITNMLKNINTLMERKIEFLKYKGNERMDVNNLNYLR